MNNIKTASTQTHCVLPPMTITVSRRAATKSSDSSKGGSMSSLAEPARLDFMFHAPQNSYHRLHSSEYVPGFEVSQTDLGLGRLFIPPKLQFCITSPGIIITPCRVSVKISKITHLECRIVLGTQLPSMSNRDFFFSSQAP